MDRQRGRRIDVHEMDTQNGNGEMMVRKERKRNRKGFIFTIDSMMSLLFAFLIITVPTATFTNTYHSTLTEADIAAMHQQTHTAPTELLSRIDGMCGEYTIYDERMNATASGKTCDCNGASPYTYVYIDESGKPLLAELKACRVK